MFVKIGKVASKNSVAMLSVTWNVTGTLATGLPAESRTLANTCVEFDVVMRGGSARSITVTTRTLPTITVAVPVPLPPPVGAGARVVLPVAVVAVVVPVLAGAGPPDVHVM
ncbi:MAG: hypothetical protein DMF78_03620 [Acidobacteria bacterium]|nr:MAG: hypothetical protein DMF78_03620 [Acidobacteriota bacterium]